MIVFALILIAIGSLNAIRIKTSGAWDAILPLIKGLGSALLVTSWGFETIWPWIAENVHSENWTQLSSARHDAVVLVAWWVGVFSDRSGRDRSLFWSLGFAAPIWPAAAVAGLIGSVFGWGVSAKAVLRHARMRLMGLLFGVGGLLTFYTLGTSHFLLPFALLFGVFMILKRHESELEACLDRGNRDLRTPRN